METGLLAEKVFLICENNTYEELEFIGDCETLNLDDIMIEAEEKLANTTNSDVEATHIINFWECLCDQKIDSAIVVRNNSQLDLKCEWVFRESTNISPACDLRKMNLDWLEFSSTQCILKANSYTTFPFTLRLKSDYAGRCSIVASLYLVDTPLIALPDITDYYLEDDYEDLQAINILIGEVEILCNMLQLDLKVHPPSIFITGYANFPEDHHEQLRILGKPKIPISCRWISSKKIEVYPNNFIMTNAPELICDVTVYVQGTNNFSELLILEVNGKVHKVVNVHVVLTSPKLEFDTDIIRFRTPVLDPESDNTKQVHIINKGKQLIPWEITEVYYDFKYKDLWEIDTSHHLSPVKGKLDSKSSCAIEYKFNYGMQESSGWLSFLVLYSKLTKLRAMESVCMVLCEVAIPEIVIHSSTSDYPIIYPGKVLYMGSTNKYSVCVHNSSKNTVGSFLFGKKVGSQADKIKIEYKPKSGFVEPLGCTHISFSLTPLDVGLYDDIYVPCFIGFASKPILLSIMCVVDYVAVYYHIPYGNQGKLKRFFWSDDETASTTPTVQSSTCSEIQNCECQPCYDMVSSCDLDDYDSRLKSKSAQNYLSRELVKDNIALPYSQSLPGECLITEMNEEEPCFPTLNTMFSSNSESSSVLQLKDRLQFKIKTHSATIEFLKVPLRTPMKKTVTIENTTHLQLLFKTQLINFAPCVVKNDGKACFNNMCVKLHFKQSDEWEESISNKNGIVIKTDPTEGEIGPYAFGDFDIWVYANTWGIYVEELIIHVNENPPFYITILVEIIGISIEFPFALNCKNAVLRFGNIPYRSPEIYQRTLKIRNYSCIPFRLSWHVFFPKMKNLESETDDPFNVIVDFSEVSLNNKEVPKLIITPAYYGIEDYSIFTVAPSELYINAKSTETVSVYINVSDFRAAFSETNVQALLIAHAHLDKEYRVESNVFSRETGVLIPPAKVKLRATIELPIIKLERVQGDVCMKVHATTVTDSETASFPMTLVFRNEGNALLEIYMHIDNPFHVVRLKTLEMETDSSSIAVIKPGHCIEVQMECVLDSEIIMLYADILINDFRSKSTETADLARQCVIIERYLNLHQHGFKYQAAEIKLEIFYPILHISKSHIDFETVCVGDCKKRLLKIKNWSGAPVNYHIGRKDNSNVFEAVPNDGVIPAATVSGPAVVIISLYFIPSEPKEYSDTLKVVTPIPICNQNITVHGIGSNDEQYHSVNL